jgi:hypothetical protein
MNVRVDEIFPQYKVDKCFGLPQSIDRRSVDRRSVNRRSVDYHIIDDPSTDDPSTNDPSTDNPSTILLAEFYNIDPQFIDRSGTSTAIWS